MLTRGRLVSRQPRAIKRTTRTELRDESIYIVKYIHWNIDIIPTALRRYNINNVKHIHRVIIIIHMMLWVGNIHNDKYNHQNIGTTPTTLHINDKSIGLC